MTKKKISLQGEADDYDEIEKKYLTFFRTKEKFIHNNIYKFYMLD